MRFSSEDNDTQKQALMVLKKSHIIFVTSYIDMHAYNSFVCKFLNLNVKFYKRYYNHFKISGTYAATEIGIQ